MTTSPPDPDYTNPFTGSGDAGSTDLPPATGQYYADPVPQTPSSDFYVETAPMSTTTGYQPTTGASAEPSTADVAKSEAGNVKNTATDAAAGVADTAKSEVANVVGETKQQAKGLLDQARSQLSEQGGAQKQKLTDTLHSLSKELGGMASKSEESGPMTDLVHRASKQGGEVAHWLESHEPKDVLEEVKSFARRRPVAFLVLAGAAGVLAGRLTRGAVAANTSLDSGSTTPDRSIGELDTGRSTGGYATTQPVVEDYAAVDPGYAASAPVTGYVEPVYPDQSYAAGQPTFTDPDYPTSTGYTVPR